MKDRLRTLATSPLLVATCFTAGLVEILGAADDPAPLPSVIHPRDCHACSASTSAVTTSRDADLVATEAVEMVDDFPAPGQSPQ
jgi:hypothetical protein